MSFSSPPLMTIRSASSSVSRQAAALGCLQVCPRRSARRALQCRARPSCKLLSLLLQPRSPSSPICSCFLLPANKQHNAHHNDERPGCHAGRRCRYEGRCLISNITRKVLPPPHTRTLTHQPALSPASPLVQVAPTMAGRARPPFWAACRAGSRASLLLQVRKEPDQRGGLRRRELPGTPQRSRVYAGTGSGSPPRPPDQPPPA